MNGFARGLTCLDTETKGYSEAKVAYLSEKGKGYLNLC